MSNETIGDGILVQSQYLFWLHLSLRHGRLSVRTCSNAQPGIKEVYRGKDGRSTMKWVEVGRHKGHERDDDDERGAEPVDVLVPILPSDGHLGNVTHFLAGDGLRLSSVNN